jgi:hypothetical protein
MIFRKDLVNIFDLYSQLNKVNSIDSLLKNNPDIKPQSSVLEIKFGDLNDEAIEDKLYQLSINDFTAPIQNGNNWFVFDLTGIKPNIPEVSQQKLQGDVEEIIRNRKTRNLYNDFYKKHFGGYTIKADDKLFIKISEVFYSAIINRLDSIAQKDNQENYYLVEKDILTVKKNLDSELLNRALFDTKYGPVTVYEFLSDLTIVDVSFEELNKSVVNKVLSNELKRFMQQETIYQIGREMGLEYSSEVKSHLEMWRDNLLSQMLKNSYNSEIVVTENEVIQFYDEIKSDSSIFRQINLQSISTHNIENVEEILNSLEDGESFEQVISKVELKEGVYVEEISDVKRLIDYGIANEIITELEEGEIFGPIKTAKGYMIFKVNERAKITDSLMLKIMEEKDQIYQNLYTKKLNKLIDDKTAEYANKYGVKISEDFILSENYSKVNIFVHRYMGFGGRIAAVPFTTPSYKWYYLWKVHSKINP